MVFIQDKLLPILNIPMDKMHHHVIQNIDHECVPVPMMVFDDDDKPGNFDCQFLMA